MAINGWGLLNMRSRGMVLCGTSICWMRNHFRVHLVLFRPDVVFQKVQIDVRLHVQAWYGQQSVQSHLAWVYNTISSNKMEEHSFNFTWFWIKVVCTVQLMNS
ncbi:hypothetical protein RND81_03G176200 [Saponaria officinalis]|uniref:Uncharacterized protein n=1 Tax=Saponaria officinalis TaxID=3572 RepID=A0AAW1M919_SAPOF